MTNYEPTICPGILLAENVIREHGTGKISIINSFGLFCSPSFPFQTQPFFVCIWLTNLYGKIPTVDITVRMEEPNTGHVFASTRNHIEIKPDAPPIPKDAILELIFPFRPITIQSAGSYSVAVLVNNEPVGHRLFQVIALTQPPQGSKS